MDKAARALAEIAVRTRPRVITKLRMNEISAVDLPANPHARVVLLKSAAGTMAPDGPLVARARAMRADSEARRFRTCITCPDPAACKGKAACASQTRSGAGQTARHIEKATSPLVAQVLALRAAAAVGRR